MTLTEHDRDGLVKVPATHGDAYRHGGTDNFRTSRPTSYRVRCRFSHNNRSHLVKHLHTIYHFYNTLVSLLNNTHSPALAANVYCTIDEREKLLSSLCSKIPQGSNLSDSTISTARTQSGAALIQPPRGLRVRRLQ